jgi:hypothetical protein
MFLKSFSLMGFFSLGAAFLGAAALDTGLTS